MKGKRGWCNNKGNRPLHFFGIPCPNQIGKELLWCIGGNPYTRLHHITFGKIVHILFIGTIGIHPTAHTEFMHKLFGVRHQATYMFSYSYG